MVMSESSNALTYAELHLSLRVARKPDCYVWDIIVPMACVCVLALSSFALFVTLTCAMYFNNSLWYTAVLGESGV